jgi:transposase
MIQLAPTTKVYVATVAIDFRKGIDGLSGISLQVLQQDPFSGAVFVFTSKNRESIKILFYDGQGFWLMQKRLSRGKFLWWPQGELCADIAVRDLSVLLWNGDPTKSNMQSDWRKIDTGP